MLTRTQKVEALDDSGLPKDFASALAGEFSGAGDGATNSPKESRQAADILVIDFTPTTAGGPERCRVLRPPENVSALILRAAQVSADRRPQAESATEAWPATPLQTQELFLKILNLRQSRAASDARSASSCPKTACFAGWTLDLEQRRLHAPNGAMAPLPGREFTMLMAFLAHPRQLVTRDLLVGQMRAGKRLISHRSLDVYIGRLRQKFRADGSGATLVATRHTFGYLFNADVVFK
jgi:two-component system, OmpR family, response regulator